MGAEDGVGAGEGGGEVDVNGLTWDGVLLDAELGDGEAVNDVLRVDAEVDFAVDGEDELAGDEVVAAGGVGGVEAEGVACAGGDEAGIGAAEASVGTGVVEVPGELHAGDADLERGGVGAGVAGGGPEALGAEGEAGEEEGDEGEGDGFHEPGTRLRRSAAAERDAGEEDRMGEGEESEGDPEIEQEVTVEGRAVGGGVRGQGPRERGQPRQVWRDG